MNPDESGCPILSDGVVTLRPWTGDDAPFMARAFADPEIRRYNGVLDRHGYPAPPLSIADAATVIDGFESSWRAFAATGRPTGGALAITDALSGEVIGCCGVDDWSAADVAQIGYWLAPSARGRGFATRAAILLTRWLFARGAARVFLTIVAGNAASVAVAERAGFVYEGLMRSHAAWNGDRYDVLWFGALPLDWVPTRDMAQPSLRIRMRDDDTCVFCDIVRGAEPATVVYDDPATMAFLPLPETRLADGHLLVIPRRHVADVFEASPDDLRAVSLTVKRVSEGLRQSIGASGVNVLNASGPHSDQSVFHLHFHVVPRWPDDGLRTWPGGHSAHVVPSDYVARLQDVLTVRSADAD